MNKFDVKDLVNIGIFGAIYLGAVTLVFSVLAPIPLANILAPILTVLFSGIIYMFYMIKIQKKGSALILAILTMPHFFDAGIAAFVYIFLVGVLTEIFIMRDRSSLQTYVISYAIFSTGGLARLLVFFINKKRFLDVFRDFLGVDYTNMLNTFTPIWSIPIYFVLTMVAAYLGAKIGARVLKKHFKHMGVI